MILSWCIKKEVDTYWLKCKSDLIYSYRGHFEYTVLSIELNKFRPQPTFVGDLPTLKNIKVMKYGRDYQ